MEHSPANVLALGDDQSTSSDIAWEWVQAQAWPGWRLDVITAAPHETIDWGQPPTLSPWEPTNRPVGDDADFGDVRFLRAPADPRVLLSDVSADLLVVGLHHQSAVGGIWIGSTAEWLLQHPPSPLALIRRPVRMERVLVGADGSTHASAAMSAFAALPSAVDTRVEILVVDDGRVNVDVAVQRAHTALGPDITAEVVVEKGHPTALLLEQAAEHGADLVVVGTRGLTGWRRLRLGSTAAAAIRAMSASALVASAAE